MTGNKIGIKRRYKTGGKHEFNSLIATFGRNFSKLPPAIFRSLVLGSVPLPIGTTNQDLNCKYQIWGAR